MADANDPNDQDRQSAKEPTGGERPTDTPAAAQTDANLDPPADVRLDATPDANLDTPTDATLGPLDAPANANLEPIDTPTEANVESPAVANLDPLDAPAEANIEAPLDTQADTNIEAPADATLDAPTDTSANATLDANTDAQVDTKTKSRTNTHTDALADAPVDSVDSQLGPKIDTEIGAPTGGYRQPAETTTQAREGDAARQHLGVFSAGPLGTIDATLELGDRLEIALNRRLLRIDAGCGLHLKNSRQLPPVIVRSADIDLGTLDVDLDEEGLGSAFGAALGIAGEELLWARLAVRPSPQCSLIDIWLKRQVKDSDGRHRLLEISGARTSLWLDADADMRLRIDRQSAELYLSQALRIVVLGVGISVAAMRYCFADRSLQIERSKDLRGLLSAPLLMLMAWIASRWLRRRLPAPIGSEGYDPWADEDRLSHFKEAFRALRRPRPIAQARGPNAAFALPTWAEFSAGLQTRTPGASMWILARLPVPGGAASQASIGIALRSGASLHAQLNREILTIRAAGGLFLYADEHPALDRLRLLQVDLRLGREDLEVSCEPALGALPRALLNQLLRTTWLPKLPPVVRELLRSLRERPGLPLRWQRQLGSEHTLTLRADPDAQVNLHQGEQHTQIEISPGLNIEIDGAPLPPTCLRRITYHSSNETLEVDCEPALGALEIAALSGLLRHQIAPRVPPGIALFGPQDPKTEGSKAALDGHVVLTSAELPTIGRAQVLLDPEDAVCCELRPDGIVLRSELSVVLSVPGIGLQAHVRSARCGFDGTLELDIQPPPGPYLRGVLETLYRDFLATRIAPWLPAPAQPSEPWVLARHRIAIPPLTGQSGDSEAIEVEVALAAGGALELRRGPKGLRLRTRGGLMLRAPSLQALPPVTITALTWDAATDAVEIDSQPVAGNLLQETAQHLASQIARPVLDRLRQALALPAGPARPPPTPSPPGPLLLTRSLPRLGEAELALARSYFLMATADDRGHFTLTIEGGLRARVRGLGLQIVLYEIEFSVDPEELSITAEPALGPLESALFAALANRFMPLVRGHLWPDGLPAVDRVRPPLARFAGTSSQGPLLLSLSPGACLRVALDRQMLELESEGGLIIDLGGAAWLPRIHLEKMSYTLADGAIDLRFGDIEELHYREAESVSTVTESILADLFRVLVAPRLPAALAPLGFKRLPPPPLPTIDADSIELFRVPLAGGYGAALLSMDADETITITASEEEAELRAEKGLRVTLPALRIGRRAKWARYHIRSGEVQVSGLGQIENAIIESAIRKNLQSPAPGGAPIAGLLDRLPIDKGGHRQLFANSTVGIHMRSGSFFTLELCATGIDFTATPPLEVDGPAVLNYELRGFTYSFAEARFSLLLGDDGVLASLFTGVVADKVESQVNELLQPLLPPAMREPGYNLAKDAHSAANLAAVVANFSLHRQSPA